MFEDWNYCLACQAMSAMGSRLHPSNGKGILQLSLEGVDRTQKGRRVGTVISEESLTLRKLKEEFGDAVVETHSFRGDDTAVVDPEKVTEVLAFLKQDPELDYAFLMDLTAVDCLRLDPPSKPYRFEVVYHLFSLSKKQRVRIKVRLPEAEPEVETVSSLWAGANWYEREVWDMFGVRFRNHPNLKRLLMYEEFVGHPLRKDYPIGKRQPLIGPGSKGKSSAEV
ncbi:MAG: NADH-quinone oxidoreductase subunit C [Acidobacteriota bacterium]